jgi:hypothetical protein
MKRLSTVDEKIIADLYQDILNENMDAASVVGVSADPVTDLGKTNGDNYAKGDTRIPKSIFKGVQTRKGILKNKKSKKSKKYTGHLEKL